ncbi:protein SCO1/2 [Lysinibacillus composti]|uniref:SCO family protein n=1 Tax=Lysinibacillus composti TaxID=720633 RepID=A0A3N9UA52_9BACI|nr:SCO family protein [Lysinibacillus composti]MBM7609940.1 protein SCO1/2 [Lysinibacillus composti]RQW73469.1 SCO family protein [Lysinibacillus composti]
MKMKLKGLVLLIVVASFLSACSNYDFKPTTEYEIEDFKAVDHRGDTVSLESLKGKPWLAMFIFTNCTTVCQPMTFNMTEIQQRLVDRGVEDYNIVAFSVDPATDTPEVLSKYFSHFTVPDESKWHLVTGYDQKFIEQFALNSFKALVKMPQEGDQVMHGVTFYLVDENGISVKNYSGYDEDPKGVQFDTIAIDMETLIEERLGK